MGDRTITVREADEATARLIERGETPTAKAVTDEALRARRSSKGPVGLAKRGSLTAAEVVRGVAARYGLRLSSGRRRDGPRARSSAHRPSRFHIHAGGVAGVSHVYTSDGEVFQVPEPRVPFRRPEPS